MAKTKDVQDRFDFVRTLTYPVLILCASIFCGYAVSTWLNLNSKEVMAFLNSDFSTAMLRPQSVRDPQAMATFQQQLSTWPHPPYECPGAFRHPRTTHWR